LQQRDFIAMRSAFYSEKARRRQFGTDAPEFLALPAWVIQLCWATNENTIPIMKNHDYRHNLASRRVDKQQRHRHDE
jgi:hypothetical protein